MFGPYSGNKSTNKSENKASIMKILAFWSFINQLFYVKYPLKRVLLLTKKRIALQTCKMVFLKKY